MKQIYLLLMMAMLTFSGSVYGAESEDGMGSSNDFIEHLGIFVRQGAADKNPVAKPALFQIVWPGSRDKSVSYSFDIGVTPKEHLFSTEHGYFFPTVEYHRHTETSRPQDNFQTGMSGVYTVGDVTEGSAIYIQGALKYKNDRIVTGSGFLGKIDVMPTMPHLAIGSGSGSDLLRYRWQPSLGIQYEYADNVMKSKRSGNILRGVIGADVVLYPFARSLDRHLELLVSDLYWYNFDRSGGFSGSFQRAQNLFQLSATCYFDKGNHFGVGYDYKIGENPEQGLLQQHTSMVSFTMRY